jgi:hypothetical protein
MPSSSWVIGSHADVPETEVSVTAGASTQTVTFPAGSYYVADPVPARSAMDTLAARIVADHSNVSSCAASLGEDRIVRLTANTAFTATFNDDTLRALLGLTGNWTVSQATQAAQGTSGYMWVPGKAAIQMGRYGTQGLRTYDTAVGMSGPGNVTATQHNYHIKNEFTWRHVLNARGWPSSEGAGSWVAFHRNVLRRFWKIKIYEDVNNDESSTSGVSLASPQGPYIMQAGRGEITEDYQQEISMYDYLDRFTLPVVSTADY